MSSTPGRSPHPRLTETTLLLPSPPDVWPSHLSVPASVLRAEEAFLAARDALQKERAGFSAELTIEPSLSALKRDDPPRPIVTSSSFAPAASLSWRPLHSEVLLAEARVLEGFASWLDAWREALISTWIAPIGVAQARQDQTAAHERLVELRRDLEQDDVEKGFDVREAELRLDEANLALEGAQRDARTWGDVVPQEARFSVSVEASGSLAALPSYRATLLRAAAVVARSERRRLAAVMPSLSVAVGVAGSRARAEAEWSLSHGRPEASLQASFQGTPQERAWASLEASFRLGSDLGEVEQEVRDAKREVQREHDAFVLAHEQEVRGRDEAWRRADAHWRLAEDRLAWLQRKDDVSAREVQRATKEARTWWLRSIVAAGRLSESWATWPTRH